VDETFSKLPNQVFYLKDEDNNKTERGSVIDIIKDDKVIIILHELYMNTSFRRDYHLNLDFFIKQCGYQVNQKSRKSFENILNKLKIMKWINFNNNFKEKIIVIDTEQLMLKSSKSYFQISDDEIKKLNSVSDLRLRMTVLCLYAYLKATTFKRSISEKTGKRFNIQVEPKPQVTWQSYEYIEKYTNISQSHMKDYIDKLKELGLIDYTSCGKKYHSQDKNKRLSECPNVYTICNINDCGNEQELELGLNQCKRSLEEKGWIVIKTEYKNNNRKLNGKKGGLVKKLNNGTITDKQRMELEKLIQEKEETKTNSDELLCSE
jgi:predicted transcriptional regulator